MFISAGCSMLAPIAGGATGGALGAAIAGPGGAAAGGALGVAGAQMAFPNEDIDAEVAIAAAQAGVPVPGTAAAIIHETKDLLWDLGWWYLLLFVLVPFLSKRGRTWMRKFTDIHNTVSQKDIDARDEEQYTRIRDLEQKIESLKK